MSPFLLSNFVHEYVCRCDCQYVGRTSQRQQHRINQPVLTSTRLDVKKGTNIDTKMQDNSFSPTLTRQLDSIYLIIRTMLPPTMTVNYQCWPTRSPFNPVTLKTIFIKIKKPILCPSLFMRYTIGPLATLIFDADETHIFDSFACNT